MASGYHNWTENKERISNIVHNWTEKKEGISNIAVNSTGQHSLDYSTLIHVTYIPYVIYMITFVHVFYLPITHAEFVFASIH